MYIQSSSSDPRISFEGNSVFIETNDRIPQRYTMNNPVNKVLSCFFDLSVSKNSSTYEVVSSRCILVLHGKSNLYVIGPDCSIYETSLKFPVENILALSLGVIIQANTKTTEYLSHSDSLSDLSSPLWWSLMHPMEAPVPIGLVSTGTKDNICEYQVLEHEIMLKSLISRDGKSDILISYNKEHNFLNVYRAVAEYEDYADFDTSIEDTFLHDRSLKYPGSAISHIQVPRDEFFSSSSLPRSRLSYNKRVESTKSVKFKSIDPISSDDVDNFGRVDESTIERSPIKGIDISHLDSNPIFHRADTRSEIQESVLDNADPILREALQEAERFENFLATDIRNMKNSTLSHPHGFSNDQDFQPHESSRSSGSNSTRVHRRWSFSPVRGNSKRSSFLTQSFNGESNSHSALEESSLKLFEPYGDLNDSLIASDSALLERHQLKHTLLRSDNETGANDKSIALNPNQNHEMSLFPPTVGNVESARRSSLRKKGSWTSDGLIEISPISVTAPIEENKFIHRGVSSNQIERSPMDFPLPDEYNGGRGRRHSHTKRLSVTEVLQASIPNSTSSSDYKANRLTDVLSVNSESQAASIRMEGLDGPAASWFPLAAAATELSRTRDVAPPNPSVVFSLLYAIPMSTDSEILQLNGLVHVQIPSCFFESEVALIVQDQALHNPLVDSIIFLKSNGSLLAFQLPSSANNSTDVVPSLVPINLSPSIELHSAPNFLTLVPIEGILGRIEFAVFSSIVKFSSDNFDIGAHDLRMYLFRSGSIISKHECISSDVSEISHSILRYSRTMSLNDLNWKCRHNGSVLSVIIDGSSRPIDFVCNIPSVTPRFQRIFDAAAVMISLGLSKDRELLRKSSGGHLNDQMLLLSIQTALAHCVDIIFRAMTTFPAPLVGPSTQSLDVTLPGFSGRLKVKVIIVGPVLDSLSVDFTNIHSSTFSSVFNKEDNLLSISSRVVPSVVVQNYRSRPTNEIFSALFNGKNVNDSISTTRKASSPTDSDKSLLFLIERALLGVILTKEMSFLASECGMKSESILNSDNYFWLPPFDQFNIYPVSQDVVKRAPSVLAAVALAAKYVGLLPLIPDQIVEFKTGEVGAHFPKESLDNINSFPAAEALLARLESGAGLVVRAAARSVMLRLAEKVFSSPARFQSNRGITSVSLAPALLLRRAGRLDLSANLSAMLCSPSRASVASNVMLHAFSLLSPAGPAGPGFPCVFGLDAEKAREAAGSPAAAAGGAILSLAVAAVVNASLGLQSRQKELARGAPPNYDADGLRAAARLAQTMHPNDLRSAFIVESLGASHPQVLVVAKPPESNDLEFLQLQQRAVLLAARAACSCSVGRGAFGLNSARASLHSQVFVPPLTVAAYVSQPSGGAVKQSLLRLDPAQTVWGSMDWPEFHNAAAAVLRLTLPPTSSSIDLSHSEPQLDMGDELERLFSGGDASSEVAEALHGESHASTAALRSWVLLHRFTGRTPDSSVTEAARAAAKELFPLAEGPGSEAALERFLKLLLAGRTPPCAAQGGIFFGLGSLGALRSLPPIAVWDLLSFQTDFDVCGRSGVLLGLALSQIKSSSIHLNHTNSNFGLPLSHVHMRQTRSRNTALQAAAAFAPALGGTSINLAQVPSTFGTNGSLTNNGPVGPGAGPAGAQAGNTAQLASAAVIAHALVSMGEGNRSAAAGCLMELVICGANGGLLRDCGEDRLCYSVSCGLSIGLYFLGLGLEQHSTLSDDVNHLHPNKFVQAKSAHKFSLGENTQLLHALTAVVNGIKIDPNGPLANESNAIRREILLRNEAINLVNRGVRAPVLTRSTPLSLIPHITSPAAAAALGLAYLRTDAAHVANVLSLPAGLPELDYIVPDVATVRICARTLIMWSELAQIDASRHLDSKNTVLNPMKVDNANKIMGLNLESHNSMDPESLPASSTIASRYNAIKRKTQFLEQWFLDQIPAFSTIAFREALLTAKSRGVPGSLAAILALASLEEDNMSEDENSAGKDAKRSEDTSTKTASPIAEDAPMFTSALPPNADVEHLRSIYIASAAGAVLGLGIRFAGTNDETVSDFILKQLQLLLALREAIVPKDAGGLGLGNPSGSGPAGSSSSKEQNFHVLHPDISSIFSVVYAEHAEDSKWLSDVAACAKAEGIPLESIGNANVGEKHPYRLMRNDKGVLALSDIIVDSEGNLLPLPTAVTPGRVGSACAALSVHRSDLESAISSMALALSYVTAGYADIRALRTLRALRRISDTHVSYGHLMASGMAIGICGLSSCRATFSRSQRAVAALFIAGFPGFPSHSTSAGAVPQLCRHLYTLSIDARSLETFTTPPSQSNNVNNSASGADSMVRASSGSSKIDTDQQQTRVKMKVKIFLKNGAIVERETPFILPERNSIERIHVLGTDKYYGYVLDIAKEPLHAAMLRQGSHFSFSHTSMNLATLSPVNVSSEKIDFESQYAPSEHSRTPTMKGSLVSDHYDVPKVYNSPLTDDSSTKLSNGTVISNLNSTTAVDPVVISSYCSSPTAPIFMNSSNVPSSHPLLQKVKRRRRYAPGEIPPGLVAHVNRQTEDYPSNGDDITTSNGNNLRFQNGSVSFRIYSNSPNPHSNHADLSSPIHKTRFNNSSVTENVGFLLNSRGSDAFESENASSSTLDVCMSSPLSGSSVGASERGIVSPQSRRPLADAKLDIVSAESIEHSSEHNVSNFSDNGTPSMLEEAFADQCEVPIILFVQETPPKIHSDVATQVYQRISEYIRR